MDKLRDEAVPRGDGPRNLDLIGRMERFPTWRTSGTSLRDEWYACLHREQSLADSVSNNSLAWCTTGDGGCGSATRTVLDAQPECAGEAGNGRQCLIGACQGTRVRRRTSWIRCSIGPPTSPLLESIRVPAFSRSTIAWSEV